MKFTWNSKAVASEINGCMESGDFPSISYGWWFRNPVNSPVEEMVVEIPFIYSFFYIPGGLFGIYEPINSK